MVIVECGVAWVPSDDLRGGRYRAWVQAESATGELSFWSDPVDFAMEIADVVHSAGKRDEDATPPAAAVA